MKWMEHLNNEANRRLTMENERLLSEQEMESIFQASLKEQHFNNAAGRNSRFEFLLIKAQDAKTAAAVIKYLDEPCLHLDNRLSYMVGHIAHVYQHRKDCLTCWAEFKEGK